MSKKSKKQEWQEYYEDEGGENIHGDPDLLVGLSDHNSKIIAEWEDKQRELFNSFRKDGEPAVDVLSREIFDDEFIDSATISSIYHELLSNDTHPKIPKKKEVLKLLLSGSSINQIIDKLNYSDKIRRQRKHIILKIIKYKISKTMTWQNYIENRDKK
jgi:DNA-binding CsgD family transcriptional regulator